MSEKGNSPVGVGVLTVLTVLLALVLAVFSALTYVTARADLALSRINAATVTAWYDADAGRLCRADLILDGMTGYALVCSLPAGQGADLAGAAQPVFGSFGLYTDETA